VTAGGTSVDELLGDTESDSGETLVQLLLDVALVLDHVVGLLRHVIGGLVDVVMNQTVFVLQFNALKDLGLDGAFSSQLFVEGVAGEQQGAGAQWAVLWASHLSNLLSVEVSAKSASSVSVNIASVNDDAGSVGGKSESWSDDLDSTVDHSLNLADEFLGFVTEDDLGEGVDDFLVNLNLHVLTIYGFNDDLGLVSKKNGDGLALGVDILDQNGHWVFSGAVLGEDVLATGGNVFTEMVGDIVEGVDETTFQGT